MERRHASLVDGVRICAALDEERDRRGLRARVPSKKPGPAVDRVVKWLGAAAILRAQVRAELDELSQHGQPVGRGGQVKCGVACIGVVLDLVEEERLRRLAARAASKRGGGERR